MSRIARSLGLLIGLGALAVPVSMPAPATAAEGCYPVNYGVKYEITSNQKDPVVTHAKVLYLPPGGSYSQSTTVSKVDSVTAAVTISTESSVSASGVIAKAEAKVGVQLQASGTSTRSTSFTETWSVENNTGGQKKYVFFHGTMKHSGGFDKKTCSYSTYEVTREPGRWRSWTVDHEGFIRCDLSYSSIAGEAKAMFC